jgi:hypothetical protein
MSQPQPPTTDRVRPGASRRGDMSNAKRGLSLMVKRLMFKRFTFNRFWAVGAALFLVLGSVAVASPANAAIPPNLTPLIWQNQPTRFCMGVTAGNMTNGTAIIVWHCNRNTDQTWTADFSSAAGGGSFLLRNGSNRNKCLTVSNSRTDNGAPLVIWDCKAAGVNADQLFVFRDSLVEAACTVFQNVNSGKVVGVTNQSQSEGARVIQWDDLRHNDQSWCSAPAPVN